MPVNQITIPQPGTANNAPNADGTPGPFQPGSTLVPDPSKPDGQIGTGSNALFIPSSTPVPHPGRADDIVSTGGFPNGVPAGGKPVPNPNGADGKLGTGSNSVALVETWGRITYVPNPNAADGQGTASGAAPTAPVANAATSIQLSSFTANWSASTGATSYALDVATDSGFSSFVMGYASLNVGNTLSAIVSGLNQGTTYYYRVRALSSNGTSSNSNTISTVTLTWPTGADGGLLINGTTLNMTTATTKDYSSVTIINGGILNITDSTGAWMIIGCSGNFTVDATSKIVYSGVVDNELAANPTVATAPDGQSLIFSYAPTGNGGAGGDDPTDGISFGGQQDSGNGGGGAVHSVSSTPFNGGDATLSHGGKGNNALVVPNGGGLGATTLGGTGANGADDVADGPEGTSGCGGGGGFRGPSGGNIYLKCGPTGTFLPGHSGGISFLDVTGKPGGNGGKGGHATDGQNAWGGSGGGGGRGGLGGFAVIRYRNGPIPNDVLSSVDNGGGGASSGGTGGGATATNAIIGNPGNDGDGGDDGNTDVATY